MGQVLHGCATTTEAVRRAYRIVKSLRALAKRYGINQKTVAKRSLLREGSDMKFAFIAKHRTMWPVAWLCDAC